MGAGRIVHAALTGTTKFDGCLQKASGVNWTINTSIFLAKKQNGYKKKIKNIFLTWFFKSMNGGLLYANKDTIAKG